MAAYKRLIEAARAKVPTAKIVISNAPDSGDGSKVSRRTAVVNAQLEDYFHDSDTQCISNRFITGFTKDGIHLTPRGTSHLARNIKQCITKTMGLPAETPRYERQPGERAQTGGRHNTNKGYRGAWQMNSRYGMQCGTRNTYFW